MSKITFKTDNRYGEDKRRLKNGYWGAVISVDQDTDELYKFSERIDFFDTYKFWDFEYGKTLKSCPVLSNMTLDNIKTERGFKKFLKKASKCLPNGLRIETWNVKNSGYLEGTIENKLSIDESYKIIHKQMDKWYHKTKLRRFYRIAKNTVESI